jgi:2'-5' RNA ligase
MKQYSIAFMPPANQIAYVKSKKDALCATIGWYHSRNSLAHITVLEFEIPQHKEHKLCEVVAYLRQFCSGIHPFDVRFNCLNTLGKAFCLLPSMNSEAFLSAVMKACVAKFPFMCFKSSKPHITIGRKLDPNQLGLGRERFAAEKPDIRFMADGLYLRMLNERRGQYEVIAKFDFLGEVSTMPKIVVQPTLFD